MPAFPPGAEWQDHVVVLRLAEGAAQWLSNPDDFVRVVLDTNCLADRVHVGKELGGQVGTDEDDFGMVLLICLCEEASLRRGQIADIREVGRGAKHLNVLHGQVTAFYLNVVVLLGGNSRGQLHAIPTARVIFIGDQRTLLRLDPGIFAGDDAKAVDKENVGSQVGDAIGNVEVEAGDHAHHDDQGGDRENYAQEREKAAEFVGSQGVQSKLDRLARSDPSSPESL